MIRGPQDLVTTIDEIVAGFTLQAQQKWHLSSGIIAEMGHFFQKIGVYDSIEDFIRDEITYDFLTAACALSRKSLGNLPEDSILQFLNDNISVSRFTEPNYLHEITSRYLLTKGDSLGGTMRNIVGQSAQNVLTEGILNKLEFKKINVTTKYNKSKTKITEISWNDRAIIFDKKPKFIDKSVDFILVKKSHGTVDIEEPKSYLACGELKGGIDPAGADEHWKTAASAFRRITTSFGKISVQPPKLFFIGAAIVETMAREIFDDLKSGALACAANLNKQKQMANLIKVLIAL